VVLHSIEFVGSDQLASLGFQSCERHVAAWLLRTPRGLSCAVGYGELILCGGEIFHLLCGERVY
jgi:hypothetical protein